MSQDKYSIEDFDKNGFAGPFDLYSEEEAKSAWRGLRSAFMDTSKAVYGECTSQYDRHLDIEFLSKHICRPEIVGLAKQVLGPNILAWRTEVHPKPPGTEGTDWHQAIKMTDETGRPFLNWKNDEPSNGLGGTLVVWTAFSDVTIENGCMQFIPGTHRKPYYDELKVRNAKADSINQVVKDGVLRGFYGYDWRQAQLDPDWKPDKENCASMTMKAGQFVVFWSTVVHSALPNTSRVPRYATNVRYVPTGVEIYPGVDRIDEAYTSPVQLDEFTAVLVSGEDKYKHTEIATKNRRGFEFPKLP
jgi:non-heme Fe2+,alpha-ketoglutarate-dependent halogenase